MSSWMQPDDDFDDEENEQGQPQVPKALRKHVAKLEKQLADMKQENEKYKAASRKTAVEDALKAKGVDPRVAAFVPADLESTQEAIEKWLTDYADLFPAKQQSTSQATSEDGGEGEGEGQESSEDADLAASMGRMSEVTGGGKAPTKEADLMAAVNNAKTREDLDKLVSAAGGGYGSG